MTRLLHRHIPVLVLGLVSGSAWAGGVQAPGLPHFFQVNERLYRGAQPTAEGWGSLAKLGVKTVIDLRREDENGSHSTAAEEKAVQAAGMRYIHIPMKGLATPSDEQISRILALLDSPDPVFVHCKEGKDRTGTVIACYRMTREGWTNRKALSEAKSRGMHFIEIAMRRYIETYRTAPVPAAVIDAVN